MIVFQRERDRLICAVQMMTRLPTPSIAVFSRDMPTRAARYYPIAGWAVGAISAAVFWSAAHIGPPLVAAILAVTAGAMITGGFHEDGLVDAFDGLGGGGSVARRLEIMKDSRIGAFGALALLLITILRIGSLSSFSPVDGALALVVAHSVARAAPTALMRFGRYAGDPAAAKLPHTDMRVTTFELLLAWGFASLPLLLLPPGPAMLAFAAALIIAAFVGREADRLIEGFTGDVLGCIEQMAEAAILISLCWSWAAP